MKWIIPRAPMAEILHDKTSFLRLRWNHRMTETWALTDHPFGT